MTDHLNRVRDIAKYDPGSEMTTVVNHLIYDAFGGVTSESNLTIDSLFLFTGRPFDSDTQLQNNLNRWYDARVGRWLSEDPIGFISGELNGYCYTQNSPLTGTDPTGLKANDKRPGGIGYCLGQEWVCNLCCTRKADRLRPIPGAKPLKGIVPMGPPGGHNETYPFPATPARPIGGGGAGPCIILVVKCPGSIRVFHFSVGDSPLATLRRFAWDKGCAAIICGGDDEGQSNCLADDVIDSAANVGINIVGVSGASGCGVTAEGDWYEVS